MTSQGEPLQDMEMLDMLQALERVGCYEADTGYIRYARYAAVLAESTAQSPGAASSA